MVLSKTVGNCYNCEKALESFKVFIPKKGRIKTENSCKLVKENFKFQLYITRSKINEWTKLGGTELSCESNNVILIMIFLDGKKCK